MSWVTDPLLGLDTETTGVDVDSDRVVAAALVRRDATGTHVRTWLLDPGVDIPAGATAVHGISTEHARAHGRPPPEALEEIATALADAVGAGVPVVAFNASFDLDLLDAELRRHALPTVVDRLGRTVAPILDPLVLDRCLDGDRDGTRRLVDLCARYGVASAGPLHTAEVDAVATLDLLDAIVRRFPALTAVDAASVHAYQQTAGREWADRAATRRAERRLSASGSHAAGPAPVRLRARAARLLRSLADRLGGLRSGSWSARTGDASPQRPPGARRTDGRAPR
jgi:DNA polymerase III subunit epsilon